MSTLEPQVIQSGYFKRWSTLTWQLWSKEPWLFGLNFLLFLAILLASIKMLVPLYMALVVLLIAVFQLEIKILELGNFNLFTFGQFLKSTGRDILSFSLYLAVLVIFLKLFDYGYSALLHLPSTKPQHASILQSFHLHVGYWERKIYHQVFGFYLFLSFLFFQIYIYLTLLIGYNKLQNFVITLQAFMKNALISFSFLIFGFVSFIFFNFITLFLSWFFNANTSVIIVTIIQSFLCLILATFGYLYAREIFEGPLKIKKTEKAQSTVKNRQVIPSLN